MAEVNLKSAQDLEKLVGWTIDGIALEISSQVRLSFQLHHIAAEKPILLHIVGDVAMGRSGNVVIANPMLSFKVEDVI